MIDYPRDLAAGFAARLRAERETLVQEWLVRISGDASNMPQEGRGGDDLLNHAPVLIEGIADYVEFPESVSEASARLQSRAKAMGALRHAQGFDAHEIIRENELLSALVFSLYGRTMNDLRPGSTPDELFACAMRVREAMELIRTATMTHFLRLSAERVREREDRLRRFNVLVSHELKNRVGNIRGAADLIAEDWLELPQRQRFQRMIVENAMALQQTLQNLVTLTRIGSDARQKRNVLLTDIVAESVRQLRDMAESQEVVIAVAKDLPAIEVDAAGVELCLVNYISNSIKYSDPEKAERWVRISGEFRFIPGGRRGELIVRVTDNGIGVAPEARSRLFEQFFRAHDTAITHVEGTGLGLSIVRQMIESLGGRAWADFPEGGGSSFAFALPSRREDDAAAAGVRRPEGILA